MYDTPARIVVRQFRGQDTQEAPPDLSRKRPVLTYAEDRFSKSVDDILSGTVPAAESMADHVEQSSEGAFLLSDAEPSSR
jgi:hypothetical protein